MDSNSSQPDIAAQRQQILGLVKRVERRVRAQRALERGVAAGVVYLMLMAVVVTLYTTLWLSADTLLTLALLLGALPVGMAIWGWVARVDRIALAQRIDRANGLHDRLSTALSLLDTGRDDAFVRAQIRDALAYRDKVDTAIAAPMRRPTDLVTFGIVAVALLILSFFSPPSHLHPLPEPLIIKHERVLSASTLAIERERLEQMRDTFEDVEDPKVQALLEEMDALLDAVENQEISEKEFLARIDQIEEEYFNTLDDQGADEIAQKLKEAAEALEKEAGEELQKHAELQEAVDAFKQKDLAKASQAINELAEKLKNEDISPAEAERLAKLLESFADKIDLSDPELQALAEKHRELFEKLKDKFDTKGNLSPDEQNQLNRAKEKLDELEKRRRENQQSPARRQLKSLQRGTKDMAEKLRQVGQEGEPGQKNDQKNAQNDAQKGPQPRPDAQQDTPGKDNKNAPDNQQANQGGQAGESSPRGDDGPSGDSAGEPAPQQQAGQMAEDAAKALKKGGDQQKSREMREQARRQLEEMKETMRRSSSNAGEEDSESAENMRKFLQRARGESGEDAGESAQQQPGDKPGGGAPGESNGAGEGAGDKTLGEATNINSKGPDTKLEGRDAEGPSKSEIIKAASEEGFATTDYKDVYVDYESVVEEVMDREAVPAGYRYYIKRYFELIKPRE